MEWRLVLYFLFFSFISYSGPTLELSSGNLVDFGAFKANGMKTAVFKIKNSGDEELKITKVRKTCGCFKVLPYPTVLKAGEAGEIKIEIDTSELSGNFSKLVFLQSNDPQAPSKILRVAGNALKLYKVSPNNGLKLVRIDFEKDKALKVYRFEVAPIREGVKLLLGEPDYEKVRGVSVELVEGTGKCSYSVNVAIDVSVSKGFFRFPISVPVKAPKGWGAVKLLLYGRIQ